MVLERLFLPRATLFLFFSKSISLTKEIMPSWLSVSSYWRFGRLIMQLVSRPNGTYITNISRQSRRLDLDTVAQLTVFIKHRPGNTEFHSPTVKNANFFFSLAIIVLYLNNFSWKRYIRFLSFSSACRVNNLKYVIRYTYSNNWKLEKKIDETLWIFLSKLEIFWKNR